jgi:hypothetical protein
MVGVPLLKVTQITSLDQIGKHIYLGDESEGNGIIYTEYGGFIDLGHVRDQADWTAYLFLQLQKLAQDSKRNLPLRFEGGSKTLTINSPGSLSRDDLMNLAGSIAYDFSVWHEIATWFGASMVPLIPERYSSFSIEDAYSNLLGVHLGIAALKSELPYEEAVSMILNEKLMELGVVESMEATRIAMEEVNDIWWTRDYKLPTRKVLLARELEVYDEVVPWLVPDRDPNAKPHPLNVPAYSSQGQPLHDYYDFSIKVNHKFPFRKMFPDREDRIVSQRDFAVLMQRVKWELANKDRLKGEEKSKYLPDSDHVLSAQ